MAAEHRDAAGSTSPGLRSGRGPLRAGWPPGTRIAALSLAFLLVPGVLAGGGLSAAAQAYGFFLGWILLPGLALAGLLQREDDELVSAGMGLALGSVLIGLLVFACRATGWFGILFAWPASAPVFWALARRRAAPAPEASAPVSGGTWLFLALLAVVLVRVPTGFADARTGWYLLIQDLVFHAGNAAELLKEGPLIDPRVAGRPLNYHLLSHAPVAAMRVVTGESITDLFRFWFLGFYPLVLVLLVFVLARELGRSAWAGLAAGLVLVLHNDLGHGLLGGESSIEFTSFLNWGLFLSPTTSLGLALLAAQGWALLRWCDPLRRADARAAVLLGLLAAGASMAKGSVMPPVIAGAFLAFAVAVLGRTDTGGRWLAAALILLAASLPATLYLSLGPGSYAGAMFRFEPWASALTSKMGLALQEQAPFLATGSAWLDGFLVALPWIVGFLGLGGVGALAWLVTGRASLRGLGPWILGTVLAGLGLGTFLLAPGNSQLFFAYDAQLLLALPAGLGALHAWRRRRGLALALLALPFLAAGAGGIARSLVDRARVARSGSELWPQWCEGAAWLRTNTGSDALLVSLESGLLLTQFAERRVALTEARYTPEGHATRWQDVNGRWRLGVPSENPFLAEKVACENALQKGDVPALARLRVSTGHLGELYLVRDEVEMRNALRDLAVRRVGKLAALDASPGLECVFRNDAMAIYRVVE